MYPVWSAFSFFVPTIYIQLIPDPTNVHYLFVLDRGRGALSPLRTRECPGWKTPASRAVTHLTCTSTSFASACVCVWVWGSETWDIPESMSWVGCLVCRDDRDSQKASNSHLENVTQCSQQQLCTFLLRNCEPICPSEGAWVSENDLCLCIRICTKMQSQKRIILVSLGENLEKSWPANCIDQHWNSAIGLTRTVTFFKLFGMKLSKLAQWRIEIPRWQTENRTQKSWLVATICVATSSLPPFIINCPDSCFHSNKNVSKLI